MMLAYTHQLFGNNTPRLSDHTFRRYAERVFNVDEKNSEVWSRNKNNRIRVVKDFYSRLPKCDIINSINTEKKEYYQREYGNDVIFLKHNHYIFVVREFKIVVTVYKEE